MQKILHTLAALTLICCNSIHGMENPIQVNAAQEAPCLPNEIIVRIAGCCRPREKNVFMKVCNDFNTCLQDRELIVKANPSTVSFFDKTEALFTYTSLGDVEKLAFWIHWVKSAGGNVDCKNLLDMTPFQVACDYNHNDIMKLLVTHGAQKNTLKPKINALHEAVYREDKSRVMLLLELDISPNLSTKKGIRPLHIATCKNNIEIVRLLLEKGAKTHKQTVLDRHTPLFIASLCGNIEMVKLLLNAGANINIADIKGSTPLHVASEQGHAEIVKLLLNAEADVSRRNKQYATALEVAQEREYTDIEKLFHEHWITYKTLRTQNKNKLL